MMETAVKPEETAQFKVSVSLVAMLGVLPRCIAGNKYQERAEFSRNEIIEYDIEAVQNLRGAAQGAVKVCCYAF